MKTKWGILAGFAAVVLAIALGCDTKGGSSVDGGGGVTNKPVILQIRFGVPVCSTSGAGALDGAVFSGGAGYVYVAPNCTISNANMYVWIKVLSSVAPSAVDHYIWTLRNWSTSAPNGIFTADTYDQVISTNGVFKVRTSANQIRYMSTTAANLLALASVYNQMIDVTVVTKDGQMASGYISVYLHSGKERGARVVFGTLTSLDRLSHARPGNFADYYSLLGSGSTNTIYLEGDFDTFLSLYDSNLNLVTNNDDIIDGFDLNSRIVHLLTTNSTYYLEATSFSNNVIGNYSLSVSNTTELLTNVPSPFAPVGSCDDISGDYAVSDVLEMKLTFNGQAYAFTNVSSSSVTITQTNCDFMYSWVDSSGLIPPVVRMGLVNFTDLTLYNEAYIPQTPEMFITGSTLTTLGGKAYASGLQLDSAGSVSGTFLGIPFTIDYVSRSSFAK